MWRACISRKYGNTMTIICILGLKYNPRLERIDCTPSMKRLDEERDAAQRILAFLFRCDLIYKWVCASVRSSVIPFRRLSNSRAVPGSRIVWLGNGYPNLFFLALPSQSSVVNAFGGCIVSDIWLFYLRPRITEIFVRQQWLCHWRLAFRWPTVVRYTWGIRR